MLISENVCEKKKKTEGGDEKVSKPTCSAYNCDVPKR